LEFWVHYEKYQSLDAEQLERLVAEYDDEGKHLGLIDNWAQQGFKHYLDWFYTQWTGQPPAEKILTGKLLEFQERLLKSGFWWPKP
jgi:hypothetical protein